MMPESKAVFPCSTGKPGETASKTHGQNNHFSRKCRDNVGTRRHFGGEFRPHPGNPPDKLEVMAMIETLAQALDRLAGSRSSAQGNSGPAFTRDQIMRTPKTPDLISMRNATESLKSQIDGNEIVEYPHGYVSQIFVKIFDENKRCFMLCLLEDGETPPAVGTVVTGWNR